MHEDMPVGALFIRGDPTQLGFDGDGYDDFLVDADFMVWKKAWDVTYDCKWFRPNTSVTSLWGLSKRDSHFYARCAHPVSIRLDSRISREDMMVYFSTGNALLLDGDGLNDKRCGPQYFELRP